MMAGGRPKGSAIKFSQKIADRICGELISGRSLNKICREDEGMVSIGIVMRWLGENEQFQQQYARARTLQAEHMAEEILEIMDEAPERIATDFGSRVDNGHVQWQKNRADARKWLMSKMAPKKYSEKVDMSLSGADGGPIVTALKVEFVSDESPEIAIPPVPADHDPDGIAFE